MNKRPCAGNTSMSSAKTRSSEGRKCPALLFLLVLFSLVSSSAPYLSIGLVHADGGQGPQSRQSSGVWSSTKLWADFKPLYCSAVGDVWPGHSGNEIIVGGESNWTTMIYGHEDSWTAQRLFQEAWYVNNIAIGDADSAEPGLEMVNVGWHGNVSMVYWEDATTTWKHKELVNGNDAGLTWGYGVTIADMDPRYPGNEIAISDDSGHLMMIWKNGSGWDHKIIWSDVGPGIIDPYIDTIVVADVDQSHPGDEILVTGGSKYVTELYFNTTALNWTVKRLWRDRLAPIQLAVGNIINTTSGLEIAVVGLSKNLTVLSWNGTGWAPEKVYQESDVIYDVKFGEVQPGKGPQIVMGSWSTKVTSHRRSPSGTGWESEVIYTDEVSVFGTTIGDCDDLHPGNEILVVDQSGAIRKLQYETPDFVLYSPGPENSAVPGASATFDIMVYSRAGFHDAVTLSLLGLEEGGGNGSFAPAQVTPTGRSLLTVSIDMDVPLQKVTLIVKGVSGSKVHTIEVVVNLLPPDEKDFGIVALPSTQSVVADYSVKYTVALYQVNGFSDPVSFSLTGLPDGATASFSATTMTPPGSVTMEIRTVSSSPLGTHFLTVQAQGGGKVHTATVGLVIKDASSPDFSLALAPSTITMVGSHSANISVNLVSLYGFSDKVMLYVPDLEKGMTAKFSPEFIKPSGTSYLNLSIDASVPADTYYLEVRGETGLLSHSAILRVDLNVAGKPDFSISASQAQVNVTASFVAFCNISLKALGGFAAKADLTVQGLPSNTNATFTPKALGPGQTSTLEIQTAINAPPGIYHLFIIAKGSGLIRNAYVDLMITPPKAVLDILRVDGVPSTAQTGQSITARVWIKNTGMVGATDCVLNMFIDKTITKTKTFSLGVGQTGVFNLTWSATEGTHNLTITLTPKGSVEVLNGQYTKTVNVTGSAVTNPASLAIIVVIIVIIVLAVVLGYVYGRKGTKKVPPKTVGHHKKKTRPKSKN
jgi:hypothetical protein